MRRLLAAALLWGLLTAAAPLPVRLTPAQPVLGVPLLVTVELPEADTELAGLPALAPFELLGPPQRQGRQLRVLLLPMRPGAQQIPSLPLLQGSSRQLATAALRVSVSEGIPAGAEAAPLKPLTTARPARTAWLAILLLAALPAVLLLLSWRRRRSEEQAPPPLESLQGELLLAELQRRLAAATSVPAGRRQELAERIDKLRFSPVPAEAAGIRQLLSDYRDVTGENP